MYAPLGRGFVETVGSKKLGEVVACVARYLQWNANKQTGTQMAPVTSVILSIAEIDAAGNRTAEPVDQELLCEFTPMDGGLIRVRPGLMDSRDDGDPKDTAENGVLVLGAEGNCLFVDEGTKINMKNPFGNFVLTCKEKGFKPSVLAAGFLPDFVGFRAWFDLHAGKKKADGTSYNDFVVDSIVRFPYEPAAQAKSPTKAKSAAPAAKAAAPAANQAATPKANGAPAPASAPAANDDIKAVCIGLLQKVSVNHAASSNSGDALTRQKITVLALQQALAKDSGIDKSQHKAIQECLKDQAWFEENAIEFGGVNSGDDKYSLMGV
jgi:pyruvate/2-oxoglutarate dehydrogenase complex dihydrolipoamide acyltransferase (E2) component